jgi:Family of unknown function (DUF5670)
MLVTIFVILLALWIVAVATSGTFGGFIHILLILPVLPTAHDSRSVWFVRPLSYNSFIHNNLPV